MRFTKGDDWVACDSDSIKCCFGSPVRYAFKTNPIQLYIQHENKFYAVNAYSVEFEVACDLFDTADIPDLYEDLDPYLINCIEPGLTGKEVQCYFSHTVILDEVLYSRLLKYTNTQGCRGYTGVVDGYSINHVRNIDSSINANDTGLYLDEGFINKGGLMRPAVAFNETKHKRFIQALESYKHKSAKALLTSNENIESWFSDPILAII